MNSKLVSKIVSGTLLVSMVGYTFPVFAYTKDETVYSKMDNTGTNYKTVVSDHIKNTEDADTIEDLTDLLNVKNTSGDETYTQDGNKFTWNANKNDIYYQGDTTKELPIDLKVKYELDGNEISAQDIAGKSGKVKITLQYTNKEARTVTVNGKSTKMYVPFVVVAGTMIKDENAKNVEVSSGKVVNDGTKTVVVGMAMPGLQESLGLSKNDVDIPSNIEITMDATDFETESIVSYATPKVFDKDDLKVFDKMDSLYADANKLQDSMNQIQDGANQLKEGTQTYSEKSQEFNSAMNKVADGVSTVNSSYSEVDNGITSLNQGSKKVATGASELDKGIGQLSTQLSSMPASVNALYEGSTELAQGINGDGTAQNPGLVNGVNTLINTTTETTTGLVTTLQNTIDSSKKTIDLLNINNKALEQAKGTMKTVNQDTTQIDTLIKQNNEAINGYKEAIKTATEQLKSINEKSKASQTQLTTLRNGMSQIQKGANQLNTGLGQLNTASKQLPSALNKLSTGSKQLITGTTTLSTGANKLSKGSTTLKSGISTLDTSTKKLTEANGQLTEGAATLADGANALSDGISTFNEEGIKKICDVINGDVKDLDERVEKLTDLSKSYSTFTMVDGKNESDVKFIMVVDAVKKQEDSEQDKENAVVESNTNTTTNNENENEGE